MNRAMTAVHRTAVMAAFVALLAASCHAGRWHSTFVVGDSTAWQVEQVTGEGSTRKGCGFTPYGQNFCTVPLDTSSAASEVVVAFVSIWDVQSPDLAGYVTAHEALTAHGRPVVWVELPPIAMDPAAHPSSQPEIDALNRAVAELLGCDLVPWERIRSGELADPLHYTPLGAWQVAVNVSSITQSDAC